MLKSLYTSKTGLRPIKSTIQILSDAIYILEWKDLKDDSLRYS